MESNFMSCATGSKQAEFDILDGFGTSQDGLTSARAYMEQHWDTWITEDDFRSLAAQGINTVRLPSDTGRLVPTSPTTALLSSTSRSTNSAGATSHVLSTGLPSTTLV